MKRFNIKEFAAWHLKTFGGPGILTEDVYRFYWEVLGRSLKQLSRSRFEDIVDKTYTLNDY